VPNTSREPTSFGCWLLELMRDAGFEQQSDLVKAAGVSPSTVSRLINSGTYTPDIRTLDRVAAALNVATLDLVAVRTGAEPPMVKPSAEASFAANPLVSELQQMLAPDSPLSPDDRQYVVSVVSRVIEPYRRAMRRRKTPSDNQ
jgi:transcriptional regulator with XRE-family HTH domain